MEHDEFWEGTFEISKWEKSKFTQTFFQKKKIIIIIIVVRKSWVVVGVGGMIDKMCCFMMLGTWVSNEL